MNGTFVQVHRRGGYFRVRGYGFLVMWTRTPIYNLRHEGRHIGPLWFRVLRPWRARIDGTGRD